MSQCQESARPRWDELADTFDFRARHLGPRAAEEAAMLAALRLPSRQALIDAVVPVALKRKTRMDLPPGTSEESALAALAGKAARNSLLKSFIGQGYYGTHTPGVILRNIIENPAWYTAYTPYQAEISQGRMEALANFQTMIAELTAMDIANASMLDEATAAAEAMTLAQRVSKSRSMVFYVADDVLPQTRAVIATRAAPLGLEVRTCTGDEARDEDCFGVLLQYPGADGEVRDYREFATAMKAKNTLVIVAADLLALTLLAPPGEWGADVVIGSAQRFGVPMGFGGPHAAYLATRDEYKRSMPGRLIGVTVDAQGNPAYRLALQTREQHIRREKATSNICTAQVLLAVIASMYAAYHGPAGLKRVAQRVHRLTGVLRAGLAQLGYPATNAAYFDTLTLATGDQTPALLARARAAGMNLRHIDAGHLGISFDETTTVADLEALWTVFAGDRPAPSFKVLEPTVGNAFPETLARRSDYLRHPNFRRYHSETEMLRYLRRLADKDIALDRSMIPLGSCTMKLNATSEMVPITWPQFAALHPLVPREQAQGSLEMIHELEDWLAAATGYDAVSLQPNAGSQGEYAGLLMIRAYHQSRGEGGRQTCLIPASAHGTNPASAQMAGMRVVVVACDSAGNVDLEDLRAKAQEHAQDLAAIMVTYPSTHGVFEAGIKELCAIVHEHGGQVYVDGANLNAMVGLAAPGEFGADISHLNLHKTFCIPHGGGGPGVGPVACKAHLAPFLPGHGQAPEISGDARIGAVSAAPYGSAMILPISWMYIAMMGEAGLTAASEMAILNANYVARRLAAYYPVLYAGANGLVAHECILDLRPLKEASDVSAEDVAKRLMDYGFHAPTMSFPVAGTLMVEPTESESKAELDRFIAAMIAIHGEITAVSEGRLDRQDNPLKNAPHTAAMVTAVAWAHPYSREQAAFPLPELKANKYWPPVARADNVYGDRKLFCACIPVEDQR
ncbi:MAG: aminomethyl-transferring glycine dehydrogenase [Betaproteobacteria bacterium]|nr:aminomethyl-transferring glycine dehydrogenase [Betaproteobacteria bacterium]